MSRYIDADALRHRVLYWADSKNLQGNHEQAKAFNYCLCMIDDTPTADVVKKEKWDRLLENSIILADAVQKYQLADAVEVKHGRWIEDRFCSTIAGTYEVRRCSVCGDHYEEVGYDWNYCPNCGARMDEREE